MIKIEKDGFICQKDIEVQMRFLNEVQQAALFRAILAYENRGEILITDDNDCVALAIAFAIYKASSDRMNKRYIDKVEKRIAAAKERWEIYNREILKSEGTKDAT